MMQYKLIFKSISFKQPLTIYLEYLTISHITFKSKRYQDSELLCMGITKDL